MQIFPFFSAFTSLLGPLGGPQATDTTPREFDHVDLQLGSGKVLEDGDQVAVQYKVCNPTGQEFANTEKRGMSFTMVLGARNSDPLLSVALAGMRVGGTRRALLLADSLPPGIGSIVPPKTDLIVWVHVIAAKPTNLAKVESPNAERTQGALEVPRVTARNGPTRT